MPESSPVLASGAARLGCGDDATISARSRYRHVRRSALRSQRGGGRARLTQDADVAAAGLVQRRERIDRGAADAHLEVEVGAGRLAGRAHAAQELAAAAILAHFEAETGPWRLDYLVRTLRNKTALREILGKTARGRELLEVYGGVFNEVLSTLVKRTEHVARSLGA